MTTLQAESEGIFEIRVRGALPATWSRWFASFTLGLDEAGNTLMVGPVIDQAELHGVLERIRDLGLPLISVQQVTPSDKEDQTL